MFVLLVAQSSVSLRAFCDFPCKLIPAVSAFPTSSSVRPWEPLPLVPLMSSFYFPRSLSTFPAPLFRPVRPAFECDLGFSLDLRLSTVARATASCCPWWVDCPVVGAVVGLCWRFLGQTDTVQTRSRTEFGNSGGIRARVDPFPRRLSLTVTRGHLPCSTARRASVLSE